MKYEKAKHLYKIALEYVSNNRPDELKWGKSVTSDTFRNITARDFLWEYCWVVYASGFRVSIIEQKFPDLRQAFQDFNLEELSKMESVEPVLAIFNNRRKANGFLKGAKKIHQEGFPGRI